MLGVLCRFTDCSDLAMILCDSQAVEVLALTVMKTLQQCSTSDTLPRVNITILRNSFHTASKSADKIFERLCCNNGHCCTCI